jgi:hypothetical protein
LRKIQGGMNIIGTQYYRFSCLHITHTLVKWKFEMLGIILIVGQPAEDDRLKVLMEG